MALARSAVHTVAMDTGAYGQLCQFLPGLLSPLFESALQTLSQSAEALGETATSLRSAADGIESTDTASARTIVTAGGNQPAVVLPL